VIFCDIRVFNKYLHGLFSKEKWPQRVYWALCWDVWPTKVCRIARAQKNI